MAASRAGRRTEALIWTSPRRGCGARTAACRRACCGWTRSARAARAPQTRWLSGTRCGRSWRVTRSPRCGLDGLGRHARRCRVTWCSQPGPQVWHNYGFDRHVLERAALGIDAASIAAAGISPPRRLALGGFAGDTLHMARLNDAGRKGAKTYSLESLSGDADVMGSDNQCVLERSKVSLKGMFSVPKLTKSGKPSKSLRELPPIHEIQARPLTLLQSAAHMRGVRDPHRCSTLSPSACQPFRPADERGPRHALALGRLRGVRRQGHVGPLPRAARPPGSHAVRHGRGDRGWPSPPGRGVLAVGPLPGHVAPVWGTADHHGAGARGGLPAQGCGTLGWCARGVAEAAACTDGLLRGRGPPGGAADARGGSAARRGEPLPRVGGPLRGRGGRAPDEREQRGADPDAPVWRFPLRPRRRQEGHRAAAARRHHGGAARRARGPAGAPLCRVTPPAHLPHVHPPRAGSEIARAA